MKSLWKTPPEVDDFLLGFKTSYFKPMIKKCIHFQRQKLAKLIPLDPGESQFHPVQMKLAQIHKHVNDVLRHGVVTGFNDETLRLRLKVIQVRVKLARYLFRLPSHLATTAVKHYLVELCSEKRAIVRYFSQ